MAETTVLKTGDKDLLNSLVRSYYAKQKVRVADGNRLCGHFKKKLGINPAPAGRPAELAAMSEEEREKAMLAEEKEKAKIIDEVKEKWGLVSTGFVNEAGDLLPRMKFDGFFTKKAEVVMVHSYLQALKQEEQQLAAFESVLTDFEVYHTFLKPTKGIGPLMSAVLLAYLDPYKANYPSKFVKFAGIDVLEVVDLETGAMTYEGRCRKEHHLIDQKYIDKNGKEQTKRGLSFKPDLKTKLVGVMVPGMIKMISPEFRGATKEDKQKASLERLYAGNPYAIEYYRYRARIRSMPQHANKSDLHTHRMALRHTARNVLHDFWKAWRIAEGLPICRNYGEEKLGLHSGGADGKKGWIEQK